MMKRFLLPIVIIALTVRPSHGTADPVTDYYSDHAKAPKTERKGWWWYDNTLETEEQDNKKPTKEAPKEEKKRKRKKRRKNHSVIPN